MKKIIIYSLFLILLGSCTNKTKVEGSNSTISIEIDTAYVGEALSTYIAYHNSEYEENTASNLKRKVVLYYYIDSIPHDIENVEYSHMDSIVSTTPNEIDLRKIRFKKAGTHFLSGYISDNLIDNNGKTIFHEKHPINHKIIIIDNKYNIAKIHFPDTLHVNKVYTGNITYTSSFDTIISELNNRKSNITRLIMLVYYPPVDLNEPNKDDSKIAVDSTFAYNLPDIPIRDIILFKEKGTYQMNSLIKDMDIFDTIKNRKESQQIPMKVEETWLSKKVVVID